MTERSWELLREVSGKALLVPTTTRSVEQYRRVALGIGTIPYALVCNGGILLEDGREEEGWYRESLEIVSPAREEMERAAALLEGDRDRCFEVREVRGLFLFTKSLRAEESAERLRQGLDGRFTDVFCSGRKVYAVPKGLTKGNAVLRLKKRLQGRERETGRNPEKGRNPEPGRAVWKVAAAGDSRMDISMLQCADLGMAPAKLEAGETERGWVEIEEGMPFSEGMLEYVKRWCEGVLQAAKGDPD